MMSNSTMPRQLKPVRVQPIVKSECVLIDGMTLPMPRNGTCRYHRSEVADMMLIFGRRYVIDAIADAKCYQSERSLRQLFPAGKNILDYDTAYSILRNYTVGSNTWFERARLISNTDGGPPLEEILNKFNVDEDNIIGDFREGLNSRSSFDDAEYNDNIPNRVSPETVVDRAIVIAPKPRYACVGVTESSINVDAENTMNIVATTTNADHISRDNAEHTMNIVAAATNADHISRDNAERNMNIVAAATTNADHISRDNAERTMNIVAGASSNHNLTLADANHCMNIVAAATNASHIYPSIAANASHIYPSIAANASKMYPSTDANQHMNIVAAAAITNASHIYPSTDANHRMNAQPIDEDSMSVTDQDDPVHRKRKLSYQLQSLTKRLCSMSSLADVDVDCYTWPSSDGAGRTTGYSDAKELQPTLYVIAGGDSARAANAITYFLNNKSNEDIKREVLANISDKNESIYEQIVMGLQESISHHSSGLGGTRTKVAETFVKNVVTAAIFHIASEGIKIPTETMMRILGTTKRQIKYAMAQIDSLISENCTVKVLTRKTRCDKIVDKLEPYIFDFVIDDAFTRVDTNAKLCEVVRPMDGEIVKEPIRLWRILSKRSQYEAFFDSKHCHRFQSDHDGATVGFTTFRLVVSKVAGKFVRNPTIKSCVDEVTTAVEYAMDAMKSALKNTQVKSLAENIVANDNADGMITYPEILQIMQGRSFKKIVERSCCAKEELNDHHYDKSVDVRTIVPRKCSHGEGACNKCGIEKRFHLLLELKKMLTDELMEAQFEVTIWHDARRAGTDKKGKHNTQKELTPVFKNLPDLIDYFLSTVQRCIPHHVNVIWQYIQTDVILSQLREDEAYVSTDFAATADLCAVEKLNSSTNAHCNICNMIVLSNRREVMVKTKLEDGSEIPEMVTVYDVDVYHSLAETFEKGKKNDHVMHTATLNHVLERTSRKFIERDPTKPLKRVIIHTDNCPSQYRCRQTLMHTAVSDLQITHNFAVVGNFKGPHDAVGKDVKEVITKRELEGTRSKDGLDAFRTCNHHWGVVKEQPKWKEYEAKNDPQLKAKGVYSNDTRTFLYCVDSKATFEELSLKYPGQIIFCDRKNILDTHNQKPAFKGTVNMHQITNIKSEEAAELRSQRKFPVYISDFFCECMKCRTDKEDECKHKTWKNKRKVVMMPCKTWIDPKMSTTTHQNDEAMCCVAASASSDSTSNSIANQNCYESVDIVDC